MFVGPSSAAFRTYTLRGSVSCVKLVAIQDQLEWGFSKSSQAGLPVIISSEVCIREHSLNLEDLSVSGEICRVIARGASNGKRAFAWWLFNQFY